MVILSHLVLLLSFAAGLTDAIRVLKDGAMVDAEGREYKTAAGRTDAENISRPQSSGGSTVHIQCTEVSMIIVVNADLYGKGRRVSAGDLFLGGTEHSGSRECRAVELTDAEYVIEAKLQNCGSTLTVTEDSVIYTNKLIVSPAASYYGITRTAIAEIPVSCHYKRAHLVSSRQHQQQHQQQQQQPQQQQPQQQQQQQQSPTLSTSAQYSTQQSAFSLKLMTDDWTSEKLTHVFYFGDLLHIEASYTSPDARQRRLFVDSCVATLTPDPTSDPTYYFIENHGCVTDAKEKGSNALFKPRKRADSLQLQLDAILFHHDPRNTIFITCQLKAASVWKSSPINKACNYKHSRWESVDGRVGVCQCCNSICHQRSVQDMTVTGTVTLGPLMIFPSK